MLEVNFSPFPEIKTARLILRCLKLSDAAAVLDLRSLDKTMQYIDRAKLTSIEEAEALIQKILQSVEINEGINWCMALIDEPEKLIGTIGFWRMMNQHYRAEVGYMLHPNYWKQGLIREAMLAVLDYGFTKMKLHSVEAHIDPVNTASANVLEKTGFIREGYFKEDFFYNGKFSDTAIYSLLGSSNPSAS